MKRFITLLAVAAFVVAIPASHWLRGLPEADGPVGAMETGEHGSASVARGFWCGVLYASTTDSHETLSASGNQMLTCHGDLPDWMIPPDKAVTLSGLACNFYFPGWTTDSKLLVTPAGEIILKCRGKK